MGFWSNLLGMNNTNITASPAAAVSASSVTSFGSFIGGGGFIGIAILAIIVTIVMIVALVMLGDWERFKQMKNFLGWLVRTFDYFLYGLLTLIVIGIPLGLAYLASTAVESNPAILYWLGGIIGAFFVISGIGYVLKPIYGRIGRNMERSRQPTKPAKVAKPA